MKIPRPNEYVWITSSNVDRGKTYCHAALIRVKEVWFNDEINEWMINTEEDTYWAADCELTDETIIENERLGILD